MRYLLQICKIFRHDKAMKTRSANSITNKFKLIISFLTKYGKIIPNDFVPSLKNEAMQINVVNPNYDN